MPQLGVLDLPSLTPEVLTFFSVHGVSSVEDFLVHNLYTLVSLAECQQGSEQLKQAVADVLSYLEDNHTHWFDGVHLLSKLQQTVLFIPTGCGSMDSLLHGGLRAGTVTELVGSSSSGKTQICMQASAMAALSGATVTYIDTCNSFSSRRISQLMCGLLNASNKCQEQHGFERALKAIFCYREYDVFSLLRLLHRLYVCISSEHEKTDTLKDFRLLVIDSVSSVISPMLSNNQVQGHALMMSIGQILKKLANDNNLAIMITNHTTTGENGPKPALGESWKTVAHVRLLLSRDASTEFCKMTLIKHTSMDCNQQASFRLGGDVLDFPK